MGGGPVVAPHQLPEAIDGDHAEFNEEATTRGSSQKQFP
jgi:hypothetical protein